MKKDNKKIGPADLIEPSISATKKFLFPFRLKTWIKLAIIIFLAGGTSTNFPGFNFNLPFEFPDIRAYIGIIAVVFLIGLVIGLIMLYIRSIYRFILIDSAVNEISFVFKNFGKHHKKGFSLFLFRAVLGVIFFSLVLLLSLPLAVPILRNIQDLNWGLISVPYLIFFMVFALILFVVYLIIGFVVNNFVVVHMYDNDITVLQSWKTTIAKIKKNLLNVFLFWILKIVLSLIGGIIIFILIIIILLVLALIALIIFFIGMLIYFLIPASVPFLIGLGIIFAIILGILFFLCLVMIDVPIQIFFVKYIVAFARTTLKN